MGAMKGALLALPLLAGSSAFVPPCVRLQEGAYGSRCGQRTGPLLAGPPFFQWPGSGKGQGEKEKTNTTGKQKPASAAGPRPVLTSEPGVKPKGPLQSLLGVTPGYKKQQQQKETMQQAKPAVRSYAPMPAQKGKDVRSAVEEVKGDVGPLDRVKDALSTITTKLQTPVFNVGDILAKFAIFTVGFFGGAGAGIYLLLSPSAVLPESVTQPITLFENILVEIDRGYVDKVDNKKLFETAVNSMLSSLDPYTEFEGEQLAKDMRESVAGRYGGVGLVIAGAKTPQAQPVAGLPGDAAKPSAVREVVPPGEPEVSGEGKDSLNSPSSSSASPSGDRSTIPTTPVTQASEQKEEGLFGRNGITVVSAFEGYAFDAGMRVGDRLLAVDGVDVTSRSVDQVRDLLRGPPETTVKVTFERPGVESGGKGLELTLTRRLVRVPDVKLTTFVGPPEEGIGYVQLQSFSMGAAREMARSIRLLQVHAPQGLKGLVLDLRSNPGGLLTSAVDVASLMIPKDSPIVSAMGRNFPSISYKSTVEPIRDASVPLAVLVNAATASAAEIVSGAVQDLDAGVIVGAERTFGKGLVQNVESLPYNTALKYTVAKYYTPSGRCIQSVRYTPKENDLKNPVKKVRAIKRETGFDEADIPESERKQFFTKHGRVVRDGGGVEADVKVSSPEASVLEVTLQQQGAFFDYANEWAKTHKFSVMSLKESIVDDKTYEDFQRYVAAQQAKGLIKTDIIFSGTLEPVSEIIKEVKYTRAQNDLDALKKVLKSELEGEFTKFAPQMKERLEEAILARYLPESMLRNIALQDDPQVKEAVSTIKDKARYEKLLAGAPSTQSAPKAGVIAFGTRPEPDLKLVKPVPAS